jgi:xanthosine utilization system XapX-like protein
MKRSYEKERAAALSAGLAVIILAWIAVQAFAPGWIDSMGVLSIWLYGPISAAAWGLLSAISYVLIIRAQGRNPALCPEHEEATRQARSAATGDLTKVPKCIEDADILELEKDKLAALMGGFAITIAGWLAVLSFAPLQWLDRMSPWIYCLATMLVWWGSAEFTYWSFRRGRQHRSSITHAH